MFSATTLLPSPSRPWHWAQTMLYFLWPSSSTARLSSIGLTLTNWPLTRPVVMPGLPTGRSRGIVPSGGVRMALPSAQNSLVS